MQIDEGKLSEVGAKFSLTLAQMDIMRAIIEATAVTPKNVYPPTLEEHHMRIAHGMLAYKRLVKKALEDAMEALNPDPAPPT